MVFFSSDHHFYHSNIIKYCSRPFGSIEDMNAEMVKRWNDLVKPKDTVYYLGDFALAYQAVIHFTPLLNGEKILIMGNHDLCHPYNKKKTDTGKRIYRECGFKLLLEETIIEVNNKNVRLNHFPYASIDDDKYGKKYSKYRPIDDGKWLLCGHVHEKWKIKNKMINVGVDVWDFKPVPLSTIEKIIN